MRTQQQSRTEESTRAVSDVIGFTLMFSIIIIGAGLISLGGGTQIEELSEREEVRNAERGMQSAAATLQPMVAEGDQQRSFSLSFTNSNIFANQTTLNVTWDGGASGYPDLQINSLEQRFARTNQDLTVRYEGGGVFRTDATTGYEPGFECTTASGGPDTAIITVVNLTLADRDGLNVAQGYDPAVQFDEFASQGDEVPITSTSQSLPFRATLNQSQTDVNLLESKTITVNATQTSGPEQWSQFFNNTRNWNAVSGESHVYQCDSDRAIVRIVTIELDIVDPRFSG